MKLITIPFNDFWFEIHGDQKTKQAFYSYLLLIGETVYTGNNKPNNYWFIYYPSTVKESFFPYQYYHRMWMMPSKVYLLDKFNSLMENEK